MLREKLKDKDFISVKELAGIMGVSVSFAYEYIKNAEFNVLKIGEKRYAIPTNSFLRWYDSLE